MSEEDFEFGLGIIAASGAALVGLTGYGVNRIIDKHQETSKSTTVINKEKDTPANKKLLEAAFEDDVKKFKEALADGGDITILNENGSSVAMVALRNMPRENRVINVILNNSKLRRQIDWKITNEVGQDALSLAGRADGSKSNLAIYNKVMAAVKEQNEMEVAKNKSRSGTNYDFYKMLAATKRGNGK